METILERVKELKDSELRETLKNKGVKLGPITPSTRKLFQKKLAKLVFAEEYPDQTDDGENESSSVSDKPKPEPVVKTVPESIQPASSVSHNNASMFFAVCLPSSEEETYGGDLVFVDKMAALSLVKKYKDSRFKVFKNRQDAVEFTKPVVTKNKTPDKMEVVSDTSGIEKTATGIAVEKSAFKGPKTSELVTLRRAIERGDKDLFSTTVWDNPRYLISSADTPVILHEGLRYNALHVAAIANKPAMCKLVLNTISNPEFTQKLYCFSHESEETKQRRIDFVFDLYLNMPDKGNGESPLHFACKFGFPDVVRVLLEYPGVARNLLNKYDETPSKVCCTRSKNPTPELKTRIEELLQGLCYVPLLRSEDNTTAALIGQPWSPDNVVEPHELLTRNPTDPQLAIRAYAGPMSPSKAQLFHRQWTIPPSPSPKKSTVQSNVRREDGEKGLERIGRQIAQEMHVAWSEYWEFLDSFVDFSTDKGIGMLEEFLLKQQSTVVYRQWVKTHSTQINNVCLDASIATEYSELGSFVENDSVNSVDSDVSPIRNDLFRHNKIDRGVVKDFDNSDNELSEVFALQNKARTSDSSDSSDKYRNEQMDVTPEFVNSVKESVNASRFVLKPAKLKYGIAAPVSTAIHTSGNTEVPKNSENLTDEIKLATPSPEPRTYDFNLATGNTPNQTSVQTSDQSADENSAEKNSGTQLSVQTSDQNLTENSVAGSDLDSQVNPETPSWRDGRIKSGESEDSENDKFESPLQQLDNSSRLASAKSDNLDDSVLNGFQKLQLGSSDEDSFKSAVSEVFSTPSHRNLNMSFNTELSNLCDDLKQKLIFTPRNRLSRTVSVVTSLSDSQEAIILKSKYSNFNFNMLKLLSNFKPTEVNPIPVLLIVKSFESMELPDSDILTDCVFFELLSESECLCISQIKSNLTVSVATPEQKQKILSFQSSVVLSLCIYKDDIPTCIELSVPALFTRLEPKDPYFILGQRASKLDQDVLRAVVADDKDMSCFPLTEKWRRNITTIQTDSQQSLPSPARIRRESRLSGEFPMMSPLVTGTSTPSTNRYSSPFTGQRSSLSPSVFQFTPRTSRFTSSPRAPKFNLAQHLEEESE